MHQSSSVIPRQQGFEINVIFRRRAVLYNMADVQAESYKTNASVLEFQSPAVLTFSAPVLKKVQMDQGQTSRRFKRMIAERNRRNQMTILFSQLTRLLPNHENASWSTKQLLETAVVHVKNLQERIEQLRTQRDAVTTDMIIDDVRAPNLPMVKASDLGSSLEVVLVCESTWTCLLSDVLNVLEEEGVEVVNVSFSVSGDTIHYIIHSQVASSRVGIETKTIYGKLMALMQLNMNVPFKSRQV